MSGIAAARYFQRIKKPFFVFDTRDTPSGKETLDELSYCQASWFGDIDQNLLNQAEKIILSPGVSPENERVRSAIFAGVPVIGDIELFAQLNRSKVIAITGSNGKSTVTDLTYRFLKAAGINAQIGGNFGKPVLDFLPENDADVYVLELSSFQLDTSHSLKPDAAVVLNISEDHMDRYPDFEHYKKSKLTIYHHAKSLVCNFDDKLTYPEENRDSVSFSLKNSGSKYRVENMADQTWLVADGQPIVNVNDLNIVGAQNWSNILAALALVSEAGVEINEKIVNEIKAYSGLPHRFQLIDKRQQTDWINDSKATNVGATCAALDSIDGDYYSQVVLIAGGDSKGSDLSVLKDIFQKKVNYCIFMGRDAERFTNLVDKSKYQLAKDMDDAVSIARGYLLRGSKTECQENNSSPGRNLVLLSPACASLDMYRNFEVRGDAFTHAVRNCA